MPFVRFSRDKRGYEYVYLVDVPARHARETRPRILYWYRTPPNLRVGREAFDEEVRAALEVRYPDVSFNWQQIAETPMPPPDPTPWRERRRLERSMKRARVADAIDTDGEVDGDEGEPADQKIDSDPADIAAAPPPAEGSAGRDSLQSGLRRRRRRGGRGRSRVGSDASGAPVTEGSAEPMPAPQAGEPDAVGPNDRETDGTEDG